MPVARKGREQDKRSDDQNAASFKFMNVEFSGRLRWLWTDGAHQSIVAPLPECGRERPLVRGVIIGHVATAALGLSGGAKLR
jgi:hypothetical protein